LLGFQNQLTQSTSRKKRCLSCPTKISIYIREGKEEKKHFELAQKRHKNLPSFYDFLPYPYPPLFLVVVNRKPNMDKMSLLFNCEFSLFWVELV